MLLSPDARRRLIREALAAAEFDHPNLVPVYETGEIGPVCFIATAFCPGQTLAEWLDRQAFPVPVRQTARLVATVAEALIDGRLAVGEISPFILTFLRWLFVLVVVWPLYGSEVRMHWPQVRPRLGGIVLMPALGMTGFNALYYVAAHYTSAINIGILQGSMPIFVLAGAYLAYGTRASLVQCAGVLVTAFGARLVFD